MRVLFCYFFISALLLSIFTNFAGSGLSCLNSDPHPEPERPSLHQQIRYQLSLNNHAKVTKLLKKRAEPSAAGAKNSIPLRWMEIAQDVPMAELLVQAGFNDFGGQKGTDLLSNVVRLSDHNTALIPYYVKKGADPSQVLDALCKDTPLVANPRLATINNEVGNAGDVMDKICALVCAVGLLDTLKFNYALQLKRQFFSGSLCRMQQEDGPQDTNSWRDKRAKKLLELRNRLEEAWDTQVANPYKAAVSKALNSLNIPSDLCSIIVLYGKPNYRALENMKLCSTYMAHVSNVKWVLLNVPTNSLKPCAHGSTCTGPCKEVFEAFGLQKPSDQAYAALEGSGFAQPDQICLYEFH
jgi:hypothetical protein